VTSPDDPKDPSAGRAQLALAELERIAASMERRLVLTERSRV
jgi:hypothetical protein